MGDVGDTASISYVGKIDYGDVAKHIEETYTLSYGTVPVLEISYLNDRFFFSLTTEFDNDAYMEKVREQFIKHDLEPSEMEKIVMTIDEGKTNMPKFGLNIETLQFLLAIRKLKK